MSDRLDTFCNRFGLDADLLRLLLRRFTQFTEVVLVMWIAQRVMEAVV